uniref:Cytochrome P450 n=1 Tax=Rhizophora mucronata TaxID=61149 RepID=A0A2P2K4D2_RHIMU
MDISVSLPTIAAATLLGFFVFLYFLWPISRSIQSNSIKKTTPEAGGAWPVIGHLHLLGGPKPPHLVLCDMADKYGPIFTIKMGVHRALVVSNWELVKECLNTNDKAFANRPKTLFTELLTYDGAMFGLAPYGPYWRQLRKIATLELLSNRRLKMFKTIRESEVRTSVKELYSLWERNQNSSNKQVVVEMKRWFGDITLNVILRIIVGKSVRYTTTDEGEWKAGRWKQAVRDLVEIAGRFVVADGLPFLRFLDIGGHEMAMKNIAKELDFIVDEWLQEHKQKKVSGAMKGEEDFMDLMLNILDDAEVASGQDSDTVNKATCLVITIAYLLLFATLFCRQDPPSDGFCEDKNNCSHF